MAIFRGTGGAGDASGGISINEVTEQATNAAASATSAANSATAASTSASSAATSASAADTSATSASTSASNAATSASAASTSETNAGASASAASASETAAAASESAAATSESNAASSASAASTSETNAANSASAASTSETNAAASESAAATSASNASTSESNAATSASAASTSASNASTSATNAANSASAAATSASEAAASAASINPDNIDINGGTIDGTTIGGTTPAAGTFTQANFADNAKAIFGAGSDLQIYHNGSNSYVKDTGAGYLILGNSDVGTAIQDADNNNLLLTSADDIKLGYNGGFKLATTSTGIDVTGTVVADALGIGTSSPGTPLEVNGGTLNRIAAFVSTDATSLIEFADDSTTNRPAVGAIGNDLSFFTNGEKMRIDSSGNVGIGTSSPGAPLDVVCNTAAIGIQLRGRPSDNISVLRFRNNAGTTTYGQFDIRSVDFRINAVANIPMLFSTNNTERMRIDSSGNLLVGTTTTALATNEGVNIASSSRIYVTKDGNTPLYVGRLTSDGNLIHFRKDGSKVGSISSVGGVDIAIGSGNVGLRFQQSAPVSLRPTSSTGITQDGTISLGNSGARFDDIYATNGTIQTSDRNEKQDIETLSEAEARVAVACKGLLRKFRWKDAVAEKGDEARIHFGIIAQDLQAAFEAEGLDAGRYAMFISSTWTDEETGEERTRMGVRYPELLAFIIAAI